MELKQLEYFTIVCEKGSFNKAADCLYTSQPNVSKVIRSLEQELGRKLFIRGGRMLQITPYGQTVLEYAKGMLKHARIIQTMADHNQGEKFSLATYPSSMIARLLTDFYMHWREQYVVEHQEGSVEEVSNWVARGQSEIGIVYVAQKQLGAFRHILSHKKLVFIPMAVKEACIYVGPKHFKYKDDSVVFSELPDLRFIRGVRDYFSMDHHLEHVSLGMLSMTDLNFTMFSNSDHVTINALLHTDLCNFGLNFMHPKYEQYDIKALKIKGCEPFLTIGYIKPEMEELSEAAEWFLESFRKLL